MKYFTIIEKGIPIGFYQEQKDRDEAFKEYILKVKRFGIKGEAVL